MRVLFFKAGFAFPHASGHDVHTFQMMRAMQALGAVVALATTSEPKPGALDGLTLDRQTLLNGHATGAPPFHGLEKRFQSYWGITDQHVAALGQFAREFRADAVVVSGLDVLPMLGCVDVGARVWYAGDEWIWHHLSQVQAARPASWTNIRDAAVKGLYERAYRHRVDRVWAVSDTDAWALRRLAGFSAVDVVPNGIAADTWLPADGAETEQTAVFWGRMDFGPNIQALEWFIDRVWPVVRGRTPAARFTVAGFRPGIEMERLGRVEGVTIKPDVPNIPALVNDQAIVVLPFVSGGGIKNKLLEAAAMSKAIVATPRSLTGLKGQPPIRVASTPDEWASTLAELWHDQAARRQLGRQSREWVLAHHTWSSVAETALDGLSATLKNGRRG